MSRSVSTHPNALATVYLYPFLYAGVDDYYTQFFEELLEIIRRRFPSFRPCDRWVGRENHVVLQNAHAEVSVAEYNGLVSVCLAACDDHSEAFAALSAHWAASASRTFRNHLHRCFADSALLSQGHASNGEQFFTRLQKPGSCVTSKEGQLW